MTAMLTEPVLTPDDLTFFRENGYVVVRGAVPAELCEAVIADMFDFLEMNRNDPATWYTHGRRGGGMCHMHQRASMWNVRQTPKMHRAFADVFGDEKLWISMDRTGMKPPSDPDHPDYEDRGFLHWDMDTAADPETWGFGVQGVVNLADTDEMMGGFQCVPGFHGEALKAWIPTQPADRNSHAPDKTALPDGMAITPIPAKQGDLIIWDRTLAHGNGHNLSDRPRLAQYVTMFPAGKGRQAADERVANWRERRPPYYWEKDVPERWRGKEARVQPEPAPLTALGRKLLGLDSWE